MEGGERALRIYVCSCALPQPATSDREREGSIMNIKEIGKLDEPDEVEVIIVEENVSIDPIQTDPNGIR